MPTFYRPHPPARGALAIGCLAACLALPVQAQGFGLAVPPADTLWPQWRARVTVVQTGSPAGGLGRWTGAEGDAPGAGRRPLGGALLGDYHFAGLGFGSLRASGGVRVGPQGGVPLALGQMTGAARLGWSVWDSEAPAATGAAGAGASPLPYLGLGFSGALWGSLSLSADLGYVAERGSTAGIGRALLGNQGAERSLRELRLSPLLQLGLRYTF